MKENHIRVTYTLKPLETQIVNHYSEYYNLSKSKFVSLCIEHGIEFMEEELEDFRKSGNESLYENGKKYSNTKPMTLSLSKYIIDKLKYYSRELKVKKSHLVSISIYLLYEKNQKELSDDIDELMNSVSDDGY